jgi:hypothetical protein
MSAVVELVVSASTSRPALPPGPPGAFFAISAAMPFEPRSRSIRWPLSMNPGILESPSRPSTAR